MLHHRRRDRPRKLSTNPDPIFSRDPIAGGRRGTSWQGYIPRGKRHVDPRQEIVQYMNLNYGEAPRPLRDIF